MDCSGIPNGLKEIDICGQCLLPTSKSFNAQCSKLGGVKPNLFYVDQLGSGVKVTVGLSGPSSSGSAVCSFYTGNTPSSV